MLLIELEMYNYKVYQEIGLNFKKLKCYLFWRYVLAASLKIPFLRFAFRNVVLGQARVVWFAKFVQVSGTQGMEFSGHMLC